MMMGVYHSLFQEIIKTNIWLTKVDTTSVFCLLRREDWTNLSNFVQYKPTGLATAILIELIIAKENIQIIEQASIDLARFNSFTNFIISINLK